MKNNKGITLIALVITIIVLLILAGVSIAMLTGSNGVLTRASDADKATTKAEYIERINMELQAQYANALAGVAFDSDTTIKGNLEDIADDCTVGVTAGTSVTITIKEAKATELGITDASGSVTISSGDATLNEVGEGD